MTLERSITDLCRALDHFAGEGMGVPIDGEIVWVDELTMNLAEALGITDWGERGGNLAAALLERLAKSTL